MKRVILCVVLCSIGASFAQEQKTDSIKRIVKKKSYISIGGTKLSYQDVKTSNLQYGGLGTNLILGTSRSTKDYFWSVNFRANYSSIKTKVHQGKGNMINGMLAFQYSRKLNTNFTLGGKWNMFEGNLRLFPETGNNSNSVFYNSTLLVVGGYSRQINDKLKVNFDLGLGLVGLVKESTSFSNYPASQYILEDGKYDFQNKKITNAFSLAYFRVAPLFKLNKIEATLSVDYSKRWQLSYNWDLINYRTVKGYPVTIARHTIGVRFNFINKTKTRINKK